MSEFRKVFGDVVKNPEAVSRGKQRARALEASGLEYLKGHGPGHKVKVAANFTRIEVAGGKPEDREDYRFVVDQTPMFTVRLHPVKAKRTLLIATGQQFDFGMTYVQYGRFLAGPLIVRKKLFGPSWPVSNAKMGDGSFLNTEGAYTDPASITTSLRHVGGGWIVQGLAACRFAQSGAFASRSVYAAYTLTYGSQTEWPAFGFHRPVSGAWLIHKPGKKADVWLDGPDTTEERSAAGNGFFGYRTINQRVGQSPFFNAVAACGKAEDKGFVFGHARWESTAPSLLAGTQPRLTPGGQHALAVAMGATKPFKTTAVELPAQTYGTTNMDACPLFAGPKGTMALLVGASVQPVAVSSPQRELIHTEVWPEWEGETVLEETFRYAWDLKAAAGGALHWIKTPDFGETWETVPEPQTAGCFSATVKLSEPAFYTRNAAEESPAPSAQSWANDHKAIGSTIRRAVTSATAAMHAEYIGKDEDGQDIMLLIVPHATDSRTPPTPDFMAVNEENTVRYAPHSAVSSRLFIGPIGSMQRTAWPADDWLMGQRFTNTQAWNVNGRWVGAGLLALMDSDTATGPDYGPYKEIISTKLNDSHGYAMAHTLNGHAIAMALDCDGYNYHGYARKRTTAQAGGDLPREVVRLAQGCGITPLRQQLCIGNGAFMVPVKHGGDLRKNYMLVTLDFGKTWRQVKLPYAFRGSRTPPAFHVVRPYRPGKKAVLYFRFVYGNWQKDQDSYGVQRIYRTDETLTDFKQLAEKPVNLSDLGGYDDYDAAGTLTYGFGSLFMTGTDWVNPAFPGEYE